MGGSVWDSGVSDVFNRTKFPKSKTDFHWVDTEEIHAKRRKEIIAKYPEVISLFGPELLTCPLVLLVLVIQIFMMYWIRDKSWPVFLFLGWAVGGTLNHTMQLASHELSHNLCFRRPMFNKLLAIVSNLCTGFPSAIVFQRYHMEHHQYQGVDGIDTDIPTLAEISIFRTTWFKVLWLLLQPGFYAFRPLYLKPKIPGVWEYTNAICCVLFDLTIWYFLGPVAIFYMVYGTLVGLGLHPCAGHFVAEHYEFVMNFETYSYYGPCNYLNFNVGYHNEHHDFPKIAWSNLSKVRKVAPEFYDDLPCYTSYIKVLWCYITDPEIGPFSRIKRVNIRGGDIPVGKKVE